MVARAFAASRQLHYCRPAEGFKRPLLHRAYWLQGGAGTVATNEDP